jgi:hypothetical protein
MLALAWRRGAAQARPGAGPRPSARAASAARAASSRRAASSGRAAVGSPAGPASASSALAGAAEVVVFEGLREWHIRAISAFAAGQLLFWGSYGVLSLAYPSPAPPPRKPDALPSYVPRESLVMQFYTHPVWGFVGFGVGAACVLLVRLYTRSLVSRISLDAAAGRVTLRTHTWTGAPSAPISLPLSLLRWEPPAPKSGYAMFSIPGRQARLIVERDGNFSPPFAGAPDDKEAREQAVLAALGASWATQSAAGSQAAAMLAQLSAGRARGAAPDARDAPPDDDVSQTGALKRPPSLHELRQRRLEAARTLG